MSRSPDILDEMTKAELLAWVREQFFRLPKRSEVLYLRWQMQSDAIRADYTAELKRHDEIDLDKYQQLANAFNASTDFDERERLFKKISKIRAELDAHHKRYHALEARQKKVDRLYEQIDIERAKEQGQ